MNRKPRVSRAFKRLTIPQKIVFGQDVINETTANAATFTNPTVPIAALQKVNDNLKTTAAAAIKGGTSATANMYAAEKVWDDTFEEHAVYVDGIAQGDATIIGQSGFDATVTETTPGTIPGDVSIKNINTNKTGGSIYIDVHPVTGASGYIYIVSSDATPPVITNGQILAAANTKVLSFVINTHHTLDINNLPAKSTVYITIAAFNNIGFGNLSAPVAVGTL